MLIIIPTFISGCLKEETLITPVDSPETPSRGFFIGFLPTPGDEQSFEEAYSQASHYSDFSPVWGRPTPFYNLSDDLSGNWGQIFVEQYIRGNGMFPIIHLTFIGQNVTLITPPDMKDATLNNTTWREAYKKAALDVVRSSKPLYFSIGNEVNRWYEKYGIGKDNPNGFQYYVNLYEEIYDSVKEISPKTKIFCTFAREIVSEKREADLDVLSMFNPEKIDLLIFTSYPYVVQGINTPSDIPDDYYSKALDYLPNKPFGFSEVGWPSIDDFGGEQAQANFISQASGHLTKNCGVNLELFGWAWMHDLNENDHLGLIRRDGTEKLAYEMWKNLSKPNILSI